MTYLQSMDSDQLRIIVCLQFEPRASRTEADALKRDILDCEHTVQAVEVTGDFTFMFEVAAPTLPWFHDWLDSLKERTVKLVQLQSCSFVCRRFVRRAKDDRALWVPTVAGLKRLDCRDIDKIAAEGDYVRVHAEGQSWLIHSTFRAVHESLSRRSFVQLHRSITVRVAFIDRLSRNGRHWIAHLKDGTAETVAKAHVREVLGTTERPFANQDVHSHRSEGPCLDGQEVARSARKRVVDEQSAL